MFLSVLALVVGGLVWAYFYATRPAVREWSNKFGAWLIAAAGAVAVAIAAWFEKLPFWN